MKWFAISNCLYNTFLHPTYRCELISFLANSTRTCGFFGITIFRNLTRWSIFTIFFIWYWIGSTIVLEIKSWFTLLADISNYWTIITINKRCTSCYYSWIIYVSCWIKWWLTLDTVEGSSSNDSSYCFSTIISNSKCLTSKCTSWC